MSAVASGVHGNHESLGTPRNHLGRLNNKKKLVAKRSSNPPASIPPMLGDINRSIEKMSLEAPPPQQV